MNDPIDKVFDTTYSVYLQSLQCAQTSYNYIRDISSDLESNVSSVINNFKPHTIPVPQQQQQESWLHHNKHYLFFLITGSSVLSAYWFTKSSRNYKKLRRANKLHNGARYETVFIVGSPLNQSIQRLVNDLNQRGFIIYITVSNESELKVIELEDSIDIRPLLISYESVKTVREAMNNLRTILSTPVLPFPNGDEHYLNLKSVLIIPDYNHFPKGLIEEIPLMEWERVLNSQFLKIINLCYNGLFKIIRDNNLQKRNIERINRVYSDDDSESEDEDEFLVNTNIGGDTKLIFIDFINSVNNSMQNFHFAEKISILLKEKLYETVYNDIQYLNQFDIPRHSNFLKQIFYPSLKSPNFINISQLIIKYSPSSSSKASESVYLSMESQYKLSPVNSNVVTRYWYKFYNFIFTSKNQKISSTRLHHKIFDMIYSTKILPKTQYISSHGQFYDNFKQKLTY